MYEFKKQFSLILFFYNGVMVTHKIVSICHHFKHISLLKYHKAYTYPTCKLKYWLCIRFNETNSVKDTQV